MNLREIAKQELEKKSDSVEVADWGIVAIEKVAEILKEQSAQPEIEFPIVEVNSN